MNAVIHVKKHEVFFVHKKLSMHTKARSARKRTIESERRGHAGTLCTPESVVQGPRSLSQSLTVYNTAKASDARKPKVREERKERKKHTMRSASMFLHETSSPQLRMLYELKPPFVFVMFYVLNV